MTDLPTSDGAGQDPLARTIGYDVEVASSGWIRLQLRDLTPAEVTRILKAARKITGARIDPNGGYLVATANRRDVLGDPDFITQAVAAYRALQDTYDDDRPVSAQDVADYFGVARASLFRRFADDHMNFTDIKRMAQAMESESETSETR